MSNANITVQLTATQGPFGIYLVGVDGATYTYTESVNRIEQHVRCNGYRCSQTFRTVRLDTPRAKAVLAAVATHKAA